MTTASWWQTGVIYQVYPRSFQDSNDDGVGDLQGVIRRLPYLAELGVDAIWLSPIFPSPMADFGYDIADYTDIDPLFGSLADFDALLEAAHRLGIRIILDLVPNHTSDQHPWFKESRSSRDNPKRDWYIWRDPRGAGAPPNNWLSEFGGSAWQYDQHTGQFYYHAFLAAQPDLNWRNPEVRAAVYDVIRFWLRRGVDGFRIDVIWHLIKDDLFRDNPGNPDFRPGDPPHRAVLPLYTADRPELPQVVAEMRRVTDEFPERVLIGEIYLPVERLVTYYGPALTGLHLPFNFTLLGAAWHSIAKLIDEYEAALPSGGWPNWVLGNHDQKRIASRAGVEQARIAAMLLLTLRGTPTIYYGDEIGMLQVPIPASRVQDPFEKNVPGIGVGRDGARTPMQWSMDDYAGFSRREPWLPLGDDWHSKNAEAEREEASSIYNLYRRLIALRRGHRALVIGAYRPIVAPGDLLLYVREAEGDRLLVVLNFSDDARAVAFPQRKLSGNILVSSLGDRDQEVVDGSIDLRGNEGLIIAVGADVDIPAAV
jgi:alpha-glucosidase